MLADTVQFNNILLINLVEAIQSERLWGSKVLILRVLDVKHPKYDTNHSIPLNAKG
jgi:hypothetical protein